MVCNSDNCHVSPDSVLMDELLISNLAHNKGSAVAECSKSLLVKENIRKPKVQGLAHAPAWAIFTLSQASC